MCFMRSLGLACLTFALAISRDADRGVSATDMDAIATSPGCFRWGAGSTPWCGSRIQRQRWQRYLADPTPRKNLGRSVLRARPFLAMLGSRIHHHRLRGEARWRQRPRNLAGSLVAHGPGRALVRRAAKKAAR